MYLRTLIKTTCEEETKVKLGLAQCNKYPQALHEII